MSNSTIEEALKELILMAQRRESPMGDPSALIAAKANLAEAVRKGKRALG